MKFHAVAVLRTYVVHSKELIQKRIHYTSGKYSNLMEPASDCMHHPCMPCTPCNLVTMYKLNSSLRSSLFSKKEMFTLKHL